MLFEMVENPKFDTQEELEMYAESLGKKALLIEAFNEFVSHEFNGKLKTISVDNGWKSC